MFYHFRQYTRYAAEHMLDNSKYMEQNYKACYGMLMLEKTYTGARLEAACQELPMAAELTIQ